MSKYTVGSVAKAIMGGFVTASGALAAMKVGADVSVLSPDQWLLVAGAFLTGAGGVFAVPNADTETPGDKVVKGVEAVIEAQKTAQAELDRVKGAVTGAVGTVPGLGPLASDLINSIPTTVGQAYSQFPDLTAFQRPQ
ncbi:hypothetical protein TIMSHEL_10 [Mycobacterium phage Timshel]|uniref:Holin n=1 Tax=Mycobacterium phage Timshel TaxID=1032895 RepID=G1DB28_9CAUD|nr:holin [Mycobacterium phage Timshel]AEJ92324.1 hypothetical protein TIMSHEL_10 [Mycobacterium phage Timshel]